MPRVVTAGVPMRMPLVTNGDCVSRGTVFLFTVMPAASSACSATLPVSVRRVAQVHEHQMVVGAAGDDAGSRARRARRPAPGRWRTTCAAVVLERRLERLAERHRLGGDHVLERSALRAGEDRLVDRLGVLGLAEDESAARAAQRLVRGGRDDVGVRHRRRMHARRRRARRSAPCPPSSTAPTSRAIVGERREVDDRASTRCTPAMISFGWCSRRLGAHVVVVDQALVGHAVAHGVVEQPGEVHRRPVREVAAAARGPCPSNVSPGLRNGQDTPRSSPARRSAAARWRARRRTAAWRGRSPAARPRPRLRSRRSSACPAAPRRTCW